jgi:gamma-glutamylcyclotransferase (GGCT)/AIG2-like uncharacterized protein YtfP
MAGTTKLFFVYGTLKEGGYYSHGFKEFRKKVVNATVKGTLYDLGSFPGMRLEGNNIVHGEVHEYADPEHVTARMDRIEGYAGPGKNNFYERVKVMASLDGEEEPVEVETYVFARPIDEDKKVDDGNWVIEKEEEIY